MSILFVACVEAGYLEDQAMVLFRSIRQWGGVYSAARIVSVQPRRSGALRRETTQCLADLEVEHRSMPLNVEFEDDPMANKIFAAAWAEENFDEDVIVFLDSDSFLTAEPEELDLAPECPAAARPVLVKGSGTEGPGDPLEDYWLRLYELCGSPPPPFIETVIHRIPVRQYWNGGLVASRRREQLFTRWLTNFRAIMRARHFPPNGNLRHLEQMSLAGTLAAVANRVKVLDGRYNYPLHRRDRLAEPLRSAQLEELVHVHYFKAFRDPGFLETIKPPLSPTSDVARWLRGMPLKQLGTRKSGKKYAKRA